MRQVRPRKFRKLERRESEHRENLFKAVTAFEHAAVKGLYILNGGAGVAALAYIGNCPGAGEVMSGPMVLWGAAGLACALLTSFCGYFSQFFFYKDHSYSGPGTPVSRNGLLKHLPERATWGDLARWIRWGGYGFALLAFSVFVCGVIWAGAVLADGSYLCKT